MPCISTENDMQPRFFGKEEKEKTREGLFAHYKFIK
jgi:hypothetical protein